MKKINSLKIKDLQIWIKTQENNEDFLSLTDMAKWKNDTDPRYVIQNWMKTKYTVEFLGHWETIHNPNFNRVEFDAFKNEAWSNAFSLTPDKWIRTTNAIGIYSKSWRYGWTYAHKDIAFEFASWLSPEFKLYLIKEFQRLKALEKRTTQSIEWQIKRSLAKTNYKLHTDAIKKQLKNLNLSSFRERLIYAEEADLLNLIIFWKTAKEWRDENPDLAKKWLNIRDVAEIEDLIVLSNLETINAYLLDNKKTKKERVDILTQEAIKNFEILKNRKFLDDVKKLDKKKL